MASPILPPAEDRRGRRRPGPPPWVREELTRCSWCKGARAYLQRREGVLVKAECGHCHGTGREPRD